MAEGAKRVAPEEMVVVMVAGTVAEETVEVRVASEAAAKKAGEMAQVVVAMVEEARRDGVATVAGMGEEAAARAGCAEDHREARAGVGAWGMVVAAAKALEMAAAVMVAAVMAAAVMAAVGVEHSQEDMGVVKAEEEGSAARKAMAGPVAVQGVVEGVAVSAEETEAAVLVEEVTVVEAVEVPTPVDTVAAREAAKAVEVTVAGMAEGEPAVAMEAAALVVEAKGGWRRWWRRRWRR